jgi:primosomal protein N'
VSGEDEKKTIEALKTVYLGLKELYQAQTEKFLFFDRMKAPIKRIENKHRYQVLMRLTDGTLLPQIYGVCMESRSRDALISVEENPANLS